MTIQIYHNPRCSKSRATLALLQEKGFEPEVIDYLKTPPAVETLEALARALGMTPEQMIRRGEAAFAEAGLDRPGIDDTALFRAIHEHPILLQRPIVVAGDRARIGRPPEAVLEIL